MKKAIDFEEIAEYLKGCSPDTKVYIGCDSERFKHKGVWYADYILAIVIHKDGCRGANIFAEVHRERDFDQVKNRPFNRMMTETYKAAELYLKTKELFYDFEVEVHLDINPNKDHGSNCAFQAAMGYIKGTCNVTPICKPASFAASFAADRIKGLHALEAVNQ